MPYTLEQFCADAKTELKRSSGPDGRKAVMARMQQLLANPDFVAKVFPSEKPEGRTTLYEELVPLEGGGSEPANPGWRVEGYPGITLGVQFF